MGDYTKPTPAVIFDMDGTLSDCDHRRHFVTGQKKNFNAFYDAMGEDTVKPTIQTLCSMYYFYSWRVIICTGRPESYRKGTEAWLKKYGVLHHELRMRPDSRRNDPDYEIKQDMLNAILKEREVLVAVDDRNQVVDMWRRNNITCLQVAEGNF
jgi:phosphoglycolate phosphatase-like HAD superfamily hydrolase